MANINLLPWREEAREQLKKEYLTQLVGVAILGVVLVFGWIFIANNQLETQQERNTYIQKNIDEMDKKVAEINELKKKKAQMIARMRVIQDLQGTRSEIVKAFDELARTIPQGVFFTSLDSKGTNVRLAGYAESNNRISSLMRSLDESYKYADSNLTKVQQNDRLGEQGSQFDLQVKVPAKSGGASSVTTSADASTKQKKPNKKSKK